MVQSTVAGTHLTTLTTLQNTTLRRLMGAPWFVSNKQMHDDPLLAREAWDRVETSEHSIVRTRWNDTPIVLHLN